MSFGLIDTFFCLKFIISTYFIPFQRIMKDVFKKISYFFNGHICPDERTGKTPEQEHDGVGDGVCRDQGEPAQRTEI